MRRPSGGGLAVAAAVGAAGLGAHLLTRWWYRRAERHVAATSAAEGGHEAEEAAQEMCAICLAKPQFRCKTACKHDFCTDCFAAWWRRQPGDLADGDLAAARCPLCTQRVSYVTAHFTPGELIDGGVARASKILLYNCCVSLSMAYPIRLGWVMLERSRVATLLTSLVLYAVRRLALALRTPRGSRPPVARRARCCKPPMRAPCFAADRTRHRLARRPTRCRGPSRSCRRLATRRCGSTPRATCCKPAGRPRALSSTRRTCATRCTSSCRAVRLAHTRSGGYTRAATLCAWPHTRAFASLPAPPRASPLLATLTRHPPVCAPSADSSCSSRTSATRATRGWCRTWPSCRRGYCR